MLNAVRNGNAHDLGTFNLTHLALPVASGIYMILNVVTGRVYVGSALNLRHRIRDHLRDLTRGSHRNIVLQSSWRKRGGNAFHFSVLELVERKTSLVHREQFYINFFGATTKANGYNMAPKAGSQLGLKRRPESNAATAAGLRGRTLSDERKAKNGEWWRSLSEEERRAHLEKRRAGLRAAHERKGEEGRKAVGAIIARTLTGRKLSPDHAEKARAAGRQSATDPAIQARRQSGLVAYWSGPAGQARIAARRQGKG